jgi:hypothetical protein
MGGMRARRSSVWAVCCMLGAGCYGRLETTSPTGTPEEPALPGTPSISPGVLLDGGVLSDAGAAPPDGGIRSDAGTPTQDAGTPPTDGGRDFSTDRSLFFGASRCGESQAVLCEDFESGTLNASRWTLSGTGLTVEASEHARGGKALHIVHAGSGASFLKTIVPFPAPNNTYYGRMFVKFVQLPSLAGQYSHWTVVAATGAGVAGEIRVGGQHTSAGRQLWGVGTDNRVETTGTGDWTTSDADPNRQPRDVPVGEWMCIEWEHKGATNETRFWWDAVEHPSMHTTSSVHGGNSNPYLLPNFNAVKIGWAEYQAYSQTFEMWLDEVVLDVRRVGCVL